MAFDWKKGNAEFRVEMPNDVTLIVTADRTTNFGTKAARGTTWHAEASHWNAATRTISRFGRDEYGIRYRSPGEAMNAAEQIYLDAIK
jgi:hypothetical protein